MNTHRPPNIFDPVDFSQARAIPIIPELSEAESERLIEGFAKADGLYRQILEKTGNRGYPFQVHCLALPSTSLSGWLQNIGVKKLSDQNNLKPPVVDICLELTFTEYITAMTDIVYIPYSSVIYLATRALEPEQEPVVIVNNMLEQYAKKV